MPIWQFSGCYVVCVFKNSPVDSCFHASRLLSSRTVGHVARLTPLPPRLSVAYLSRSLSTVFALSQRPAEMPAAFSCSFSCVIFRPFSPSLETGENTRSVFVFPFCVLFRRLFSPSHKRPAEILVTLVPSHDLFRLLGPARTVVSFVLSPFTFLRLTVGRVIELLIRILPHRLFDASV